MSDTPTSKFLRTLGQTPGLAKELNGNLTRLKSDIDEIIKVLGYAKSLDDNLKKLDKLLTDTSNLLTIVSVVPEVGEAAAAVNRVIKTLQPEVKSAKNAADKIESVAKPLRDALSKLDPVLDKLIKATAEIEDKSATFLKTFTAINDCVQSLPDGKAKQDAITYLDKFSSAAEPPTAALNKGMSDLNSVITDFYDILNKIKDALNPLKAIDDAVQKVMDSLNPLISLLKNLEDELKNIKIPVLIPYPHMMSLYDIFEDLKGIAKWIDEAMKPIQDLVDEVLKALHIDLSIPGLSDILNIHIDMPEIPDFTKFFKEIEAELTAFLDAIKDFSLKCPPED